VLLAIAAGFYGSVLLASESGEVVTLWTRDGEGQKHATRLWVVDHAGAEWVRTGHPGKGWYTRARANPRVDLERGDAVSARTAVPVLDPDLVRAVNEVFAEKYGAADWIVALSGDASKRVPVRLDPARAPTP
jgi:hypothetical protein